MKYEINAIYILLGDRFISYVLGKCLRDIGKKRRSVALMMRVISAPGFPLHPCKHVMSKISNNSYGK